MHRFLPATAALSRGLATAILLAFPVAVAAVAAPPAAAQDETLSLRGDPDAEAAEREKLFTALAAASNSTEAQAVASDIWTLWFRAPNADAAAVMQEALGRRAAHDYASAMAILDKLVEIEPDWAEAWNQRATMRYLLRDHQGSLDDIERVLALEPKHFGALSGEALILMSQGRMDAGQAVLREAVSIHPFLSERALLLRPEGQDI
jgi:tetratricopeptide (TPR) repeat protein